MHAIKLGTYPKMLITQNPSDGADVYYVIQCDYLNRERMGLTLVTPHGNWQIRKDDIHFKVIGTLEDIMKEQISKEVLDLIAELPDLSNIFPKSMWPDMAVINDGLSADDIVKVYSVDSLVQMLVRAQLLINHIEPIIAKLKPTKTEERDTERPAKRVPSPKASNEKLQMSGLSEEFIKKHFLGKSDKTSGKIFEAEIPATPSGQYYRRPDGTIAKVPDMPKRDVQELVATPSFTETPNPYQRYIMTQPDLNNIQTMVTDSDAMLNEDDVILQDLK